MTVVDTVIAAAEALSEEDQIEVINALLCNLDGCEGSVDGLFDQEFRDEIARRTKAIDDGIEQFVSWSEVKARLLALS